MDLILWRHAHAHDAQEGESDLQRALSARGQRQAVSMAHWLDKQLPETVRVLCSPAVRTQQTALALRRKFKVVDALAPGGSVSDVLAAATWPKAKTPVLLVGHQPNLGLLVSHLLFGMGDVPMTLRKGAVWWLRCREREGKNQTVIVSVMTPEKLC